MPSPHSMKIKEIEFAETLKEAYTVKIRQLKTPTLFNETMKSSTPKLSSGVWRGFECKPNTSA